MCGGIFTVSVNTCRDSNTITMYLLRGQGDAFRRCKMAQVSYQPTRVGVDKSAAKSIVKAMRLKQLKPLQCGLEQEAYASATEHIVEGIQLLKSQNMVDGYFTIFIRCAKSSHASSSDLCREHYR